MKTFEAMRIVDPMGADAPLPERLGLAKFGGGGGGGAPAAQPAPTNNSPSSLNMAQLMQQPGTFASLFGSGVPNVGSPSQFVQGGMDPRMAARMAFQNAMQTQGKPQGFYPPQPGAQQPGAPTMPGAAGGMGGMPPGGGVNPSMIQALLAKMGVNPQTSPFGGLRPGFGGGVGSIGNPSNMSPLQ